MQFARLSRYFLAVLLLAAGIGHLAQPALFLRMVPETLPSPELLVLLSGIAELLLGTGLLVRRFRRVAAWLVFAMLVVYTPLHVVDLFRAEPVIGPYWVAVVRLPVQGVLMWMAWVVGVRGFLGE